jgi:hypothetical protein
MWSITWNIESTVRCDEVRFKTKSQAYTYANYYKSLLEVFHESKHLQKRFCSKKDSENLTKNRIKVSFTVDQLE